MLTLARRTSLNVGPGPALVERIQADEESASALEVPVGTRLVRVSRTMLADSRPVAYLVDTLPEEVLHPDELTSKFSGSVLDYLLQRGDPLTVSRTEITASNATADVAKMLEIQRGDVLLQFTAKLISASGKVVDYSHSYFVPAISNSTLSAKSVGHKNAKCRMKIAEFFSAFIILHFAFCIYFQETYDQDTRNPIPRR
jgi:GntR family transcriptional regulator